MIYAYNVFQISDPVTVYQFVSKISEWTWISRPYLTNQLTPIVLTYWFSLELIIEHDIEDLWISITPPHPNTIQNHTKFEAEFENNSLLQRQTGQQSTTNSDAPRHVNQQNKCNLTNTISSMQCILTILQYIEIYTIQNKYKRTTPQTHYNTVFGSRIKNDVITSSFLQLDTSLGSKPPTTVYIRVFVTRTCVKSLQFSSEGLNCSNCKHTTSANQAHHKHIHCIHNLSTKCNRSETSAYLFPCQTVEKL